jgi:WD repeat-containing protein 68
MKNRISIIGLLDERCLWEEELDPAMSYGQNSGYGNGINNNTNTSSQDFVCLAEAHHGFPPTKVAWQPSTAQKVNGFHDPGLPRELLASTADGLRIWEYTQATDGPLSSQFGKFTPPPLSGRLQQRVMLTGVRAISIFS